MLSNSINNFIKDIDTLTDEINDPEIQNYNELILELKDSKKILKVLINDIDDLLYNIPLKRAKNRLINLSTRDNIQRLLLMKQLFSDCSSCVEISLLSILVIDARVLSLIVENSYKLMNKNVKYYVRFHKLYNYNGGAFHNGNNIPLNHIRMLIKIVDVIRKEIKHKGRKFPPKLGITTDFLGLENDTHVKYTLLIKDTNFAYIDTDKIETLKNMNFAIIERDGTSIINDQQYERYLISIKI